MSFNTLWTQSVDVELQQRVISCTVQQAFNNLALAETQYAALVRAKPNESLLMMWPVCLNTEAEYASALAAHVPRPGANESVITDGMILSAVQHHWPADPPPPPEPPIET